MSLTNEKIRLLCDTKTITPGSNPADNSKVLAIWKLHSDEEQLRFKAPISGLPKAQLSSDALQQYEPQVIEEHQIPSNFTVVTFTPIEVDHLLVAPPSVVADSRRKPQQYESLTQPFKKDRRFIHVLNNASDSDTTKQWTTTEVNP